MREKSFISACFKGGNSVAEHIGEMIMALREEKGYTQGQLCKKICSTAELANIERGQREPGHFLLDRLFERLGRATDRLEYVLTREIYRLYELQFQIQREILYKRYVKAEQLIAQYASQKAAYPSLHRQFLAKVQAQIAWRKGEKKEKVLAYLEEAICQTMDLDPMLGEQTALSGEELKLLLFRWEVSQGTEEARGCKELWKLTECVERVCVDEEELAKVYPYAVLLFGTYAGKEGTVGRHTLLVMTEKAFELLRESGQILFVPEILKQYMDLLKDEEDGTESAQVTELEQMREALLSVEREFGVAFEKFPMFSYMNRVFELDYDVIRRSRMASKLSQERLCEDICTQETLSRIESAKRAPSSRNMRLLLKKMKRDRERVGMNLVTEKYELLALEKKIAAAEHRHRVELAKAYRQEIQKNLDLSVVSNQQYSLSEKVRQELRDGKYSKEEGIQKLYEILQMTLKCEHQNIYEYSLTDRESNILNLIAISYCEMGETGKGIKIWRKLLENYEGKAVNKMFFFRRWELVSGNLCGNLQEIGKIEEPIQLCKRRIQYALHAGRGQEIGRSLIIIACVLLENNLEERMGECLSDFFRGLNLYKLTKYEYRYRCVVEYLKGKDILLDIQEAV